VEREAEPDRPLDRLAVRHRECAGMREADRARARVRVVERPDRAAAEHLRARLQVHVDLEADDRFPAHRSRSGTKSNSTARSTPGAGWNACPARKRVFSENCGPINCNPTGSPSERPQGIERPGSPAMFEGIVSTSARYMASGFSVREPSGNATVGEVGDASRSKRSNSSSCSRLISVRTFCAWP